MTIGQINAGRTCNVIPETVHMLGTARWFNPRVGALIEDEIRHLATGIAESSDAGAGAFSTRSVRRRSMMRMRPRSPKAQPRLWSERHVLLQYGSRPWPGRTSDTC